MSIIQLYHLTLACISGHISSIMVFFAAAALSPLNHIICFRWKLALHTWYNSLLLRRNVVEFDKIRCAD